MRDATLDPSLRSWVGSAEGHLEFPLQNLPLGRFSRDGAPRAGTAVGDEILDLTGLAEAGLLPARESQALGSADLGLNAFLALGAEARRALRVRLVELLALRAR